MTDMLLPVKADGSKFRIMIVDDAQFMLMTLEKLITAMGADVIEKAHDGVEAIEKYKWHMDSVDLVTLDITMPKMNGIDALAGIMAINPKARCVMVSALGSEDVVKEAILKGAKNFILKPFKPEKIFAVLKMVLPRAA